MVHVPLKVPQDTSQSTYERSIQRHIEGLRDMNRQSDAGETQGGEKAGKSDLHV